MDSKPALNEVRRKRAAKIAGGVLFAGAIVLITALAAAQDTAKPAESARPGFFGWIGRWMDQTTDNFNAGVTGIRKKFDNFGQEAGVAARTTVDNTKAAVDAVGRIPNTRVVRGHEKCKLAPNGAPDCIAATVALCKANGFSGGSSLDMTTAEVCPPQVYLSGRSSGEGCHTETFVSRVVCQ